MFRNFFSRTPAPVDVATLGPEFPALRTHVARRIAETSIGQSPFYHLFIDHLLPEPFFEQLHARMRAAKTSGKTRARKQDSAKFVNRRFRLANSPDPVIRQFQAIFQDHDIKSSLLTKFYANADKQLVNALDIHHREFEFVFCKSGWFQNIHVDIPPKYMSFVFYLPEAEVSANAEEQNATLLYDRNLKPVHRARFRRNSVCIFVPHFYSYHGFSTTMERDVLVMFYINDHDMAAWQQMRKSMRDTEPDYAGTLDLIEDKLRRHPLIEYGPDGERLARERASCRINAPQGRVHID